MRKFAQESKVMQMQKKALEAAAELELRRSKRDARYFLERYIYIEDRDSPELAVPFELWPKQAETLQAFVEERLTIVLKARQLGLTWLALAYALWRMLFQPGYAVVVLSKREDDAKELTRRMKFMLEHLPKWMVRPKTRGLRFTGPTWEATTLSLIIYHPSGESSTFTALTSSPDSGRSFTASLVILDEWAFQQWAEEIWSAAYPTINRPTGGQVIGLSTARRVTLFERIWEEAIKGKNGFTPIFLPWHSDPRRTQKWYEQTKDDLPHTYMAEYPSTAEEAFSAGEGMAFPEFSRDIHVVKPFDIPSWWRKWRSNDPGYNDPFVWYWFAISEDGKVYVYREYTRERSEKELTYLQQAEEVTRLSTSNTPAEEKEDYLFTVAGRDAFNPHPETGKAYIDYYRQGGVTNLIQPPRAKQTDRILRTAVLHEYLRPYFDENIGKTTAKLQIFNTCTKLIEILPQLAKDPKDPEKVEENSRIDHAYDALGYGLVAWHARQSKAPKQPENEIQRHKNKLARRSRRNKKRIL